MQEEKNSFLDRLDYENGYSLYVGFPFAHRFAPIVPFSSGALSDWKDRVEEYVDALCKELIFIAERSKDKKLNTIYIGGGTPTTLSAEQLERLLACIDREFFAGIFVGVYRGGGTPRQCDQRKAGSIEAAWNYQDFD